MTYIFPLQMGHDLYYIGSAAGNGEEVRKAGVAETFLRLFEEYPKSQEFFSK
jgi:hypothetical protein